MMMKTMRMKFFALFRSPLATTTTTTTPPPPPFFVSRRDATRDGLSLSLSLSFHAKARLFVRLKKERKREKRPKERKNKQNRFQYPKQIQTLNKEASFFCDFFLYFSRLFSSLFFLLFFFSFFFSKKGEKKKAKERIFFIHSSRDTKETHTHTTITINHGRRSRHRNVRVPSGNQPAVIADHQRKPAFFAKSRCRCSRRFFYEIDFWWRRRAFFCLRLTRWRDLLSLSLSLFPNTNRRSTRTKRSFCENSSGEKKAAVAFFFDAWDRRRRVKTHSIFLAGGGRRFGFRSDWKRHHHHHHHHHHRDVCALPFWRFARCITKTKRYFSKNSPHLFFFFFFFFFWSRSTHQTHSNSSDALDKIRFEGLTDKSKLESQVCRLGFYF